MYIFVLFSKRLLLFQSTGLVKASLNLTRLDFASVKVKSRAVQAVLVFIVRIGAALFQCAKAIKRRVRGERCVCGETYIDRVQAVTFSPMCTQAFGSG